MMTGRQFYGQTKLGKRKEHILENGRREMFLDSSKRRKEFDAQTL
ncbi:Bgt-51390 [Blumeria graminis f. sp. tritici]|uniref:Bgt-51390 n=1 Tax=Blumeria graminis f. sp. tritici TaxID=62690 RepID=A0A9X9MKN6_BLUGR|nr:Bgt-51390 [Blumeria graminis f. sp. tritici]